MGLKPSERKIEPSPFVTRLLLRRLNPSLHRSFELFLGNIASGWSVETDQSDLSNLRLSDLQTAKMDISGTALSATMKHKMGLVQINLASISADKIRYYINSPTYTKNIGTYEWFSVKQAVYASATYSSNSPYCNPYQDESYKHFYITKASGTTQFSAANTLASGYDQPNSWTETITNPSIADGGYISVTKTPTTTYLQRTAYTLALGDVFYSDGSISKPGSSNLYTGKTPIGVVVFIPANDTEKAWAEPTHNGGRALVMALKNSVNSQVLYDNTVSGGYPTYSGKHKTATTNVAYSDWGNDKSGYSTTHTYLSTSSSPAGYYALSHNPAGPSSSSGWFLPTVGQWIYALAPRASLAPSNIIIPNTYDSSNLAFKALNGYLQNSGASYTLLTTNYYWPNTNWISGSTVGVWNLNFFDSGWSISGESNKTDGDHLGYVRPFLAF